MAVDNEVTEKGAKGNKGRLKTGLTAGVAATLASSGSHCNVDCGSLHFR